MLAFVGLVLTICASCAEPNEPAGPRLGVPLPTVDQQISDGCARFQVRFDAGGSPIIEPIYASGFSSYCSMNELKLLSDTAGTFDPATRTLRLAVVMENMGTAAVIPRVKLRFNADSVIRLDGQGNPVPGTPDILGYQPDSASANGRNAFWFFDQSLAPSGQPQVLMPGARTQRRWLEFRGTGWTDRVRLKLFATGAEGAPIPATVPDSLPRKLLVESRVVTPSSGFRYYRDILLVSFNPGTSLAERVRVLGLVSASVVGGFPNAFSEGGTYVILLPSDSSQTTLVQAETLIAAQGSVLRVRRYYAVNLGTTYLRPNDGAVWSKQSWRVGGDSLLAPNALRDSWGVQYVRAPMAWGCSTGDAVTHVGFVDNGFRTGVSDLPGAFALSRGTNLPGDTVRHGTQVLSVVAAQGDNLQGITGLAWRARFSVADPTAIDSTGQPARNPTTGARVVRPADALQFIYVLASAGAQVINISLGAEDSATQSVNLTDTAQVRQAREFVGDLSSMLTFGGRTPPLLVISAGNVPLGDPRGGLFPFLKDSLPAHTLVIAAMARDSTLQRAPQGSPYIDLVAPGVDIGMIDDRGPSRASGASFAAPIVTGIAAMVRSFDVRLPPDSLRSLLIEGAIRRGRRIGGYPVVDAFESLRLAAQRSGAPLCGNRIWAAGTDVFAQRTSGPEKIATLPSTWTHPNRLLPFHGGRLFWAASGGDIAAYEWTPSGFATSTRLPEAWEPFRGTTVSLQATHDGDSTAIASISGASTLHVEATGLSGNFPAGPTIPVGNPIAITGPVSQTEKRCVRFDFTQNQRYECADSLTISLFDESSTVRVLPSPGFGRIAVAVTRRQGRLINEISQVCLNQTYANPPMCPKFVFEEEPLSTRMLVLRRSDGAVLADWTVSGVSVHPNTFSEDDTELAVEQRHVVRQTALVEIPVFGGLGWQLQIQLMGETTSQCALAFYDQLAGQATPAATIPLSSNRCVESIATSAFGRVASPLASRAPAIDSAARAARATESRARRPR